jgi:hypothetical protein
LCYIDSFLYIMTLSFTMVSWTIKDAIKKKVNWSRSIN